MHRTTVILFVWFTLLLASCLSNEDKDYRSQRQTIAQYPIAMPSDSAMTVLGMVVRNPYYWLEHDSLPQTQQWIAAQRKLTDDYIQQIPYYNNVRARLNELHDCDRVYTMQHVGERYFYRIGYGLSDGCRIYIQESLNSPREVFFDADNEDYDGKVSYLTDYNFSADGKYMAMVVHPGKKQTDDILVWDVELRQELEVLSDIQNTMPCWYGNGFFYGKYDKEGPFSRQAGASQQIFYHEIGAAGSQDKLIVPPMPGMGTAHKLELFQNRYLMVSSYSDRYTNSLAYIDLEEDSNQLHLINNQPGSFNQPLGMTGDTLYLRSNAIDDNGGIFALSIHNPTQPQWNEIIPGSEYLLCDAFAADHHLIVTHFVDGAKVSRVFDLEGNAISTIEMPNLASADFQCSMESKEIFYTAQSFAIPPTIYKYDIHSNTSVTYVEPNGAQFEWKDPSDRRHPFRYVTERIIATANDGTRVPVIVTYRKDMKRNGKSPCVLVGYGSFGTPLLPNFDFRRMILLEHGCIFAQVCARGGAEYGDSWHRAGMRLQKDNTFADFEAACRQLVADGYTSPNRLAIQASGIGGLAVAVMANRHPELFAVGVPTRPVLDMMHYHQMRGCSKKWITDWGTIEESTELLKCISDYDPITNLPGYNQNTSNVNAGQNSDGSTFQTGNETATHHYPAILCLTAEREEKIVAAHAYKYIAALQQRTNIGDEPKLVRIADGGHSKTTRQAVDEYCNFFCFFWYNIGMKY